MASIVYSTASNIDEAKKIARIIVSEKLVACVNIIPKIESIYRWQGKVHEDTENILIAKTTDSKVHKTIDRIKELHSYEVSDIVSFPIKHGLKEYLFYIEDETK